MDRVLMEPVQLFGYLGVGASAGVVTVGHVPEVGGRCFVDLSAEDAWKLAGLLRDGRGGVAGVGLDGESALSAVDVEPVRDGAAMVSLCVAGAVVRTPILPGYVDRFADVLQAAVVFADNPHDEAWGLLDDAAVFMAETCRSLSLGMFYPLDLVANAMSQRASATGDAAG